MMIKILKYFRLLLYPFALIYQIGIWSRNKFFDFGIFKSRIFSLPIICVGNLTVGGTGKTPFTEYIIKLLNKNFKIAVLSRGYKRKTKGYFLSKADSTPIEIGDEPVQIKNKFPDITLAVDEKRVNGIQNLISEIPGLEAIILDDAFQHRYVKAGLNILLTDFNRLFYNDHLLPVGMLREDKSGKKRANIIVVTKCPIYLSLEEKETIEKKIKPYDSQKIFFTGLYYKTPVSLFNNKNLECNKNTNVLLVTGIANPLPLLSYLEHQFNAIEKLFFKDHNTYTNQNINKIYKIYQNIASENKIIITTEKDAVKLKLIKNLTPKIKDKIFYIPVYIDFLFNSKQIFENHILDYVKQDK